MNSDECASPDKIARVLEFYHQQLRDHESPSLETADLNPEEREQLRRLSNCLVQLEQLRAAEQSLGAAGMASSTAVSEEPDHEPEIGRIGRFAVVRELGRGGLGVVFLARDELLNRLVALKLPRPEVLITPGVRERFDNEARATARLTHPNLVPVHEVGQVGPIVYIVSAYCEGPSLSAWLEQHAGCRPARQAAQLIAPLADAVHYAHGQGIMHRDIKPSNIMLEPATRISNLLVPEGQDDALPFVPKLVDFGLARMLDVAGSHTRTGTTVGSFGYMSPEQAEGRTREIGPPTDVHGLGSVLYECLTGRAPYLGESEADCLRRIVCEEPRPPRLANPRVPRDLEAICLKCLEKSASRRYASAGELAADLRRFLAGEPSVARPLGNLQRAWRWARRRPSAAGLVAVSILAATMIVAISLLYTVRLDRTLAISEQRRAAAEANARIAHDSESRVRQHVYVADMRVAQQLVNDGDLTALAGVLDQHQPSANSSRQVGELSLDSARGPFQARDLRGFEWRYLNRFRDTMRFKIDAHRDEIDAMAFSAAGDRLLTASVKEARAKLWEIPSGRLAGSFQVRAEPLPRSQEEIVAISSDGRRVAALIDARSVAVWDVESLAEVGRFTHQAALHSVAFLSDGTHVVGGGEDETIVWNCDSGEPVHRYAGSRLLAVCPGGGQLGIADWRPASTKMHLHDVPATFPRREIALSGPVKQLCYSPDGTMVASLCDSRALSDVRVHHPRTCALLLSNPGWVDAERYSQIAFSSDSRWLVALVADGGLKFWDSRSGVPMGELRGPATRFTRFAFSPDNRLLSTATPDGSVLIWDKSRLEPCDRLSPANKVQGPVAFSGDGKLLGVATDDRSLLLVDAATGRVERRLTGHLDPIRDIAFSPAGDRLVTTDGEFIYCWDPTTSARLWSANAAYAHCVAWSPTNGLIASAGGDRQIHLYHASDGSKAAVLPGHNDEITGLAFLPNSDRLISGSLDATLRFWDTSGRVALGEPFSVDSAVDQIVLSPTGTSLVTGYRDGRAAVWKVPESRRVERTQDGWFYETGPRSLFSFSADEELLGVGGYTGKFRAIDLATGKARYTLSGRRVGGRSIAYGADRQRLATVSPEGCLTLWNLESWQTQTIEGSPLSVVRSLAFSHDGETLAIATDDSVAVNRTTTAEISDGPAISGLDSASPLSPPSVRRPWDASGPGFRLWNVATGLEQSVPGACCTATPIPLVAWSRQGVLATGSNDGTVWIWHADRGRLVTRFHANSQGPGALAWPSPAEGLPKDWLDLKQFDPVVALAFSPDGERLAVATRKGSIQLVGGADWSEHLPLCSDAVDVSCLAFTPSGGTLIANRRGAVLSWNLHNLDTTREPVIIGAETDSRICSAACSNHGRTLALGRESGTVQLINVASPDVVTLDALTNRGERTLKGHIDRVNSLAFSPDDRTLATGSSDTTVRLWNVESAQEVAALRAHHGKVESVAFSPSGNLLATGGQRDPESGEVLLWRTSN